MSPFVMHANRRKRLELYVFYPCAPHAKHVLYEGGAEVAKAAHTCRGLLSMTALKALSRSG